MVVFLFTSPTFFTRQTSPTMHLLPAKIYLQCISYPPNFTYNESFTRQKSPTVHLLPAKIHLQCIFYPINFTYNASFTRQTSPTMHLLPAKLNLQCIFYPTNVTFSKSFTRQTSPTMCLLPAKLHLQWIFYPPNFTYNVPFTCQTLHLYPASPLTIDSSPTAHSSFQLFFLLTLPKHSTYTTPYHFPLKHSLPEFFPCKSFNPILPFSAVVYNSMKGCLELSSADFGK